MARSTKTLMLAAALLALSWSDSAAARPFILDEPADAAAGETPRCGLQRADADRSSAASCTGCHPAAAHATHPVEMDYEEARLTGSMARDLRPVSELRSRGIRLVDGKVSCVTCHDGRSSVAGRLALPAGSMVRGAVSARSPATFAFPTAAQRLEHVQPGAKVSPTALCKACHALD